MEPSVEQLFETASDYELVMGICGCIDEKRQRADLDLSELPREQEVVVMIISAMGIIGNGGFFYFDECNGDTRATAEALELIGATSAAEIMRDGFDDEEFWDSTSEIDQKLAAYIRSHKDAYSDLPPYVPDE